MTPAEIAITAALGASFLTALGSVGVVLVQQWRRERAHERADLLTAVRELLTRSIAVGLRAQTMGEMAKARSGLLEGVDVLMHIRKPLDHMQLHDWFAQDVVPLNAALDEVWTRWDQGGIRLANDVVATCMDLVDTSIAATPSMESAQLLRTWLLGRRSTPEARETQQRALQALALARKRLADYARGYLHLGAADLFADGALAGITQDALGVGPTRLPLARGSLDEGTGPAGEVVGDTQSHRRVHR